MSALCTLILHGHIINILIVVLQECTVRTTMMNAAVVHVNTVDTVWIAMDTTHARVSRDGQVYLKQH